MMSDLSEEQGQDKWLAEISRKSAAKAGDNSDKQHISLSIFSFPVEKLFPICVDDTSTVSEQCATEEETGGKTLPEFIVGTKFTCRVCTSEFGTLKEQHDHFKTPLHVVNLKRSVAGMNAVSSIDIESDDSEDECGDNDNDDEEFAEDQDVMDGCMKFSENKMFTEGTVKKHNDKTNGSVVVFQKNNSNWEFSISSSIFGLSTSLERERNDREEDPWVTLRRTLQIFRHVDEQSQQLYSCVLVLRSGMFAGAIFEGNKCILHKVFRRYTVRAKAGGGQSSFDSNGRKAKSAGATLRRYGEQALKEDIQALLLSWMPYLQSCVVVLTAIPKTMKHYVFSDAIQRHGFSRDDSRIRSIPFMVKKPTFDNIKAVQQVCTRIEFNYKAKDESDTGNQGHPVLDTVMEEDAVQQKIIVCADLVNDEAEFSPLEVVVPEILWVLFKELMEAINTTNFDYFSDIMSRIAAVASADFGAHADLSAWYSAAHSLAQLETPLHRAAECGFSLAVLELLRAGASPAMSDIRQRFPYFLAKDRETREAFRRYRGECDEKGNSDRWDWNLCGIPTALTDEMLKGKKEKEKEKKKKAKQRKQLAKQERVDQDEVNKIAKQEEIAKLQEAEERNIKIVGECGFCQKSLMGIVPLDIFDRRCCSSGCVVMMRRKLTAEAAEKRFKGSK